jgi:hypothetical protein
MIVNYKGFEIDVRREECMAGYDLVYRNVFRTEDGWQFWGDYCDDGDTVRTHIKSMKFQIDEYLKDPEQYEKDRDAYYDLFELD